MGNICITHEKQTNQLIYDSISLDILPKDLMNICIEYFYDRYTIEDDRDYDAYYEC